MSSGELQVPDFRENLNDTLDDIEDIDVTVPIKRRGKGVIYDLWKVFSLEEFSTLCEPERNDKGYVKGFKIEENRFCYKYKRNCKNYVNYFYECSPVMCNFSSYLFFTNENVIIFVSDIEHNHTEKTARGIPQHVKDTINELFDFGVTTPKSNASASADVALQAQHVQRVCNKRLKLKKL